MTKLPDIEVQLSGTAVSDLWFNWTNKPAYDELYKGPSEALSDTDAVRNALIADAKDFSKLFGSHISPEELADDFLARL